MTMASLREPTFSEVLTILEAARELRFSKGHVSNILNGRVPGVPPLPHLKVGRRILIRRISLARWVELVENHGAQAQ